jgi:hypothetical protein
VLLYFSLITLRWVFLHGDWNGFFMLDHFIFIYNSFFYIYIYIYNKNADSLLLLWFACTCECCRKHTTLSCKMEKGGGKGFSLPSKEPKSSLKSCKDALHYSTCIFPFVPAIFIFIKEENLMGFN